MRHFLKKFPKFQKVPCYVFGEAYGGKMAAEFALQLETVPVPSCLCKTCVKGNQTNKFTEYLLLVISFERLAKSR